MTSFTKFYALISLILFLSACANGPENFELQKNSTPVDDKYQWDLTDLYPDLDAWNQARLNAAKQVTELPKLQGSLGQSASLYSMPLTKYPLYIRMWYAYIFTQISELM